MPRSNRIRTRRPLFMYPPTASVAWDLERGDVISVDDIVNEITRTYTSEYRDRRENLELYSQPCESATLTDTQDSFRLDQRGNHGQ